MCDLAKYKTDRTMHLLKFSFLTLRDAKFLWQGNGGTVVILINNYHCQRSRTSQSWTSSIRCCNYKPLGGKKGLEYVCYLHFVTEAKNESVPVNRS